MFWWRKRKQRERAEAEQALQETRRTSARIQAREERDKHLFRRIGEIRRQNHIADAVGKLMEGR